MANPTKLSHALPTDHAFIFSGSHLLESVQLALAPSIPTARFPHLSGWVRLISLAASVWILWRGIQWCARRGGLFLLQIVPFFAVLLMMGHFGIHAYLPRYFCGSLFALMVISVLGLQESKACLSAKIVIACVVVSGANLVRVLLPSTAQMVQVIRENPSVLPSQRLRSHAALLPAGLWEDSLCSGNAVVSSDFYAAEFLLHFCPHRFFTLRSMNAMLFPPSREWHRQGSLPRLLIYAHDTPSRHLFPKEEVFFSSYSKLSERFYDKRSKHFFTLWWLRDGNSRI